MAGRPPKKGIDYAGWSVDIFDNDTKIDKLLEKRGWVGFGIYFYLCQRAYGGEGYFYKWSYDDSASTSRKMGCGISAGTVQETVGYCLHLDLFDKGLFDRQGILTSRGIQRRYWEVVKARDVRTVISDYWLLHDDECKGLIKVPININFPTGNANFDKGKSNFNTGNANFPALKESKGNESKGNKNTICTEQTSSSVQEADTSQYVISIPLTNGEHYVTIEDYEEFCRLYPGVDVMQCLRSMRGWSLNNPKKRKTKNGVRRFINSWLDREQNFGNQVKQNNTKSKWMPSEKRDYDFQELEKELLSN